MEAVSKEQAGLSAKPIILHLVGGNKSQGGMLNYVRQLVHVDLPGFEQRIWKYKGYLPENDKYVCLGRARVLDTNLIVDLKGVVLDFFPLYKWLRKNPKTILYAHNRTNAILGALMHILCGAPVLVHVHSLGRKKFLNRLVWRLARATVIFNSRLTCRHFGQALEMAHIHTPTIRWPSRPEPGEGRLVACGAIQAIKNIHLIIEAFNAAGDGAPQTLHIYGLSPDPFEPHYQERIIALAKENPRIFLHNWDERWSEHLGYTDLFIHASRLESFGIVMLEAFAKGCRMVVPHDTFLDDLTQEGVYCADLTAESLAMAVRRASSFKQPSSLWETRRIFEKQFAIETTREQLGAILRPIVGSASPFTDAMALSQKVL